MLQAGGCWTVHANTTAAEHGHLAQGDVGGHTVHSQQLLVLICLPDQQQLCHCRLLYAPTCLSTNTVQTGRFLFGYPISSGDVVWTAAATGELQPAEPWLVRPWQSIL